MTYKTALAELDHGGGKTVVVLPADRPLKPGERRAALRDVGDCITALDGRYVTGPDVATTCADMATIAEHTSHVFCRPAHHGGSGDPSAHTAHGVLAAVGATAAYLFGDPGLARRHITLVGLGKVGVPLAHALATAGATLLLSDIDPARRGLATELGARWLPPEQALLAPTDVLIPAALGGVITPELVERLRCAAIVGPANNQLADDSLAEQLHRRDILWAPDYLVSAGGIIHAVQRELHQHTPEQIIAQLLGIGDTLTTVLNQARTEKTTPHAAATHLALSRIPTCPRPAAHRDR